jgi:hypothetical protein
MENKKFDAKEYGKQWRLKNKEKIQQWNKEFYQQNRTEILKELADKRKGNKND